MFLNLSGCPPSRFPSSWETFVYLQSLTITHASLSDFPDISSCVALEVLDLSFNNIKAIPSLESHTRLKSLEMVKNEIQSFKSFDGPMPKSLTKMDLRFNELTSHRGYRIYISNRYKHVLILDNHQITPEDLVSDV
jgi:Leucine-rich repeat (LRR) protein